MAMLKRLASAIPAIARHNATAKNKAAAGSAKALMQMRRQKMGPLTRLEYDGDPLDGAEISDDPVDGLNDAINALGETVKKVRAEVAEADKPAVAESAKTASRQSADLKEWSDAKFFFVTVFDTGGQCTAFLEQLKVKCHLSAGGDAFIDGRHVADALGFTLPEPEYKLKSRHHEVKSALTKTKIGALGADKKKGKGK